MLETLSAELAKTALPDSSGFQPSGRVTVKAPLWWTKGLLESVKGGLVLSEVASAVGSSAVGWAFWVAVGLAAALVAVGWAGAVVAVAWGFWVGRGRGVAVGSAALPPLQASAASASTSGTSQTKY